jgi:hypothetical protein
MTEEHQQLLEKCKNLLSDGLTSDNYAERFKLLLDCEEHQMNIDIRNFDMNVSNL